MLSRQSISFHNKTCIRSDMESVIEGLPLEVVELLEQTNCCANKIELVSLEPVLIFYQLVSNRDDMI